MPQYRLKSRNRPLPNGVGYIDGRTNYQAKPFTSFDQTCQEVLSSRLGNPGFTKRYNLSTDINVIESEVDQYLGKFAHDHGWSDFYISADAVNAPPIFPEQIKKNLTASAAVAGAKTILDMMGPEGPVALVLAEKRALTCVDCPKHERGTWESLFTIPVANQVRKLIGVIHGADLRTSQDQNLRVCGVCKCPCITKVWARREHIEAHIPDEDYAELPETCWIKTEKE